MTHGYPEAKAYRPKMLHELLTSNRGELIKRCKAKVARRFAPSGIPAGADHGVPLFLEQLVDTLHFEQQTTTRPVPHTDPTPAPTEIGRAAALHGAELLRRGYSVDQVVHDYGDVCQAVTELAVEQKAPIAVDEFRTLNRCLDNAIADAVTAFGREACGRDRQISLTAQAESLHEYFGAFSQEQRRLLDMAIQTCSALQTGNLGMAGATGTVHKNSLLALRALVDASLSQIRRASAKTSFAGGQMRPPGAESVGTKEGAAI